MSGADFFDDLLPPPVLPPRDPRPEPPKQPAAPAYDTLRAIPGSEFIEGWAPLEQLVDGIIPRNRVISVTGPTGHAKTAIATVIEVCLVAGLPFAGKETAGGSVLVLCGENPDDYAMRLIATSQCMGIDGPTLDRIGVIPDVFNIEHRWVEIEAEAERLGGVCAVIVDTSAAFFVDGDENDNVAMRRHASSMRTLTQLPGNPAVLVLCHPTKSAGKENLLPRGGGAFLAEVDGNLTCWKDEAGIVTLHWSGKFRGPGFDPMRFELKQWELEGVRDAKGRAVMSVVAVHLPEDRAEQISEKAGDDQDVLLVAMQKKPGASLRDLAKACGWISATYKPLVSRVERRLKTLEGFGLAEQDRKGAWRLTTKGHREADRL